MDRIENCISFLLGKAYQQVNAAAKRRLVKYRVTPVQYAVLKILWEQDSQSGSEIGERLQLDSATITGVLDRLARENLIVRQADAGDRRVHRIMVTAQGRALQMPLDQEMDALNVEVFGQFSVEDADRLRVMLAHVGNVEVAA